MFKTLHTDRLLIRPLASSDSAFILDLLNSQGWLEFIGDRNVYTLDEAAEYIACILENPKVNYLVFAEQSTGAPLGILTFIQRDELPLPDFGFAILPQYEGKGFTHEASHVFLHFITALRRADHIPAITLANNTASKALLEKLGFHLIGLHESKGELLELYQLSR